MAKRAFITILILISADFYCYSQSPELNKLTNRTINWGISGGVNALTPIFCNVSYNDMPISNLTVKNEVSYFVSVFSRINLSNFFMQPELSYFRTTENIKFTIPATSSTGQDNNVDITPVYNTVKIPVLLGYNIVKDSHYLLNAFAGPVFKYNYKNTYQFSDGTSVEQLNKNVKISNLIDAGINVGLSANISHLYFDFRYEFSLSDTEINFNEMSAPPPAKGIKINKKENILIFSCGVMF